MRAIVQLWAVLSRIRLRLASNEKIAEYYRRRGMRIGRGCRLLTRDYGSEPYLITIGDETLISNEVMFLTHDGGTWVFRKEHPATGRFGRITVGNRVFIGARAILLPGVTVGDGSVIGAGAVVTKNVAPGTVVAGVPARAISTVETYKQRTLREYPLLEEEASGRPRSSAQLRRLLEELYPLR